MRWHIFPSDLVSFHQCEIPTPRELRGEIYRIVEPTETEDKIGNAIKQEKENEADAKKIIEIEN